MKKKTSVVTTTATIGIIVVLLIAFKGALFSKEEKKAPEAKSTASRDIPVQGIILKPEKFRNQIFSTGTILPNEQIDLRSEISGIVTGIYFQEDKPVKKGALLVKIYDKDLKAKLDKINIQIKLAEEDEARKRKLIDIEGISTEEYDKAVSLVNTLKADAALLQSDLSKTEIRAPFSGRIGLRQISVGSYVSPATLIATLQEINPVKIEFSIPEKYVSTVKKGSEIEFTLTDNKKQFTGKVYASSTSIDLNTRTLTLRAIAPNSSNELTPGAFVKIQFTLNTIAHALFVPADAIIPELGGQKVFVARGGKAVAVPVKVGIRTEKEIQILEGLNPSDTVLMTALLKLKDGSSIDVNEIVEKDKLLFPVQTN